MFDFLKTVTVNGTDKKKGGGGRRIDRNPKQAHLRVYYDGSVYPSETLVATLNLEYDAKRPAEDAEPSGNGFDVYRSVDASHFISLGGNAKCIWISTVARTEGRIDLFGQAGYDKETGAVSASVLEQGSKTFGKDELLPMIKEVYGIELDKENKRHVDLVFVGADGAPGLLHPFKPSNGKTMVMVPKTVSRGKDAGTPTLQRRDEPSIFCLYPVDLIEGMEQESSEADVEENEPALAN